MALGTHTSLEIESDRALSAQLRKDRERAIQDAVLAERERCAKIADGFMGFVSFIGPLHGAGVVAAAEKISQLIRGGQ